VAVNTNGQVFVTGYSTETTVPPYNYDYVTVSYSSQGTPLWTNRYNGPGNDYDSASAAAVDNNGDVFVTGRSVGSGLNTDFTTIKYSAAGTPLWTNRYDGAAKSDEANVIVVDRSGNVIVAGGSSGSDSSIDYATVKYSNAGVPLWTNRYNGSDHSYEYVAALAVSSNGTVFVTGYSYGSNIVNADYLTVAYSSAGLPLWTNRFNGSGNSDDLAHAIAVDDIGNVFVTGESWNGAYSEFLTIKYSNAGLPLWTNRYIEPNNRSSYSTAVAVDRSGNVIASGYSVSISNNFDFVTVGWSNAGLPLWTNRYRGPGNGDDRDTLVAMDRSGNVYVTGQSVGAGSDIDYATIKYSSSVTSPVRLDFETLNAQLVLSWDQVDFGLQCAPTLGGTFTNIPGATSPYTNTLTGAQQFFRLISN
jgi:hypothetical protein